MNSKLIHITLPLLVMMSVVGCGYDRHEECLVVFEGDTKSIQMRQLALFADSGDLLPEGSVVGGRVVANDSSGNIYRSIVLEDEGVGVEVKLALYDLYALFPVGCYVAVRCGGLAVEYIDGALAIGRAVYDWSGGVVEPIAPRSEVLSRVTVTATGESPEALRCGLGELQEALCGRLVEIGGLHYEGEPTTWGSAEYAGYADRTLFDAEGNSIDVRTSHYADFALEPIPQVEMTIRGILYKEKNGYVMKLRDGEDVVL
mgnify:CR=1 FL=1